MNQEILAACNDNFFLVEVNENKHFIDSLGNVYHERCNAMQCPTEGFFVAKTGDTESFINVKTGQVLGEYDKAFGFSRGVSIVQIDGKWGFIDILGNFVIPPIYDPSSQVADGKYFVLSQFQGPYGLMDKSGEFIIPFDSWYFFMSYVNDYNVIVVQNWEDKEGIIDLKQNIPVPLVYSGMNCKNENMIFVYERNPEKCGVINLKNEVILPIKYSCVDFVTDEIVRVYNSGNELTLHKDKTVRFNYFNVVEKRWITSYEK